MKWPTELLGSLCDVISGGTPKRTVEEYWNGEIPWVKICDMLQGEIKYTDESITAKGLRESPARLLEPGTLLLSIFATVGRTAVLAIPAATNQAIVGLRIKTENLDQRYLRHYLDSQVEALKSKSRGVAQDNINTSILKSLEIPLPPLEEQRRIAAILDKAKILEALAEKATWLHEGLLDAFFLSRVGNPAKDDWPTRQDGTLRLSDVAHIRTGKLDANAARPNGQYPFFTCSKATLSIDSFCFDGEAVLVAGNGDLNVKRHSGKLNAYQRTYIISPKSASPEEADYIYSLLRLYIVKLRSLSIGGVIKYIKLPFLSELSVGPINSGVALEISSLQRRLSAGSSLRSTASARIDSLALSLITGLMES